MALAMILVLLEYERGHAVSRSYIAALAAGLIGVAIYRGDYRGARIYRVGLCLAAWYALTRVFTGDHYLTYDINACHVLALAIVYGLGFPMAAMLDDGKRREALDRFTLPIVLALGVLCWLGVVAALSGRMITIPILKSNFGLISENRLYVMSLHPNVTAAPGLCGLFMTLYLLASRFRPWRILPAAVLAAGFAATVWLSGSRTAQLALLLGLVIGAVIVYRVLPIPPVWRKRIVVCCVVLVVAVAAAGVTLLVDQAVRFGQNRTTGVTGRTLINFRTFFTCFDIYRVSLEALKAHPQAVLTGFDELELPVVINRFLLTEKVNHMHNSFLQALMLTGLPGLIMVVWLAWALLSAILRVLFAPDDRVSPAQKLLTALPATLFLHGMMEYFLFLDCYTLIHFLFLLYGGYVVHIGGDIRWRDAFPRLAGRRGQRN